MASMFVTDFTIENRAPEKIVVTPVGTVGAGGHKILLPTYYCSVPAVPAVRQGEFAVEPGRSIRIWYDCDDRNFSEIIVRGSDGAVRELVVDPKPTENQYHAPSQKLFAITDLTSLPPVRPEVQAATRNGVYSWRLWALTFVGLGALVSFWALYRKYKKTVINQTL